MKLSTLLFTIMISACFLISCKKTELEPSDLDRNNINDTNSDEEKNLMKVKNQYCVAEWKPVSNNLLSEINGSYIQLNESAFYTVPIYAIQASNDDGSDLAAITSEQVQRWLDNANEVFKTANIKFTFDGTLHPLANTNVSNVTGDNDPNWGAIKNELNNIASREQKLVVAFRSGGHGGGFSWWEYDFVVMPGFYNTDICSIGNNLGLFAHELGHYFGLPHTFRLISPNEAAAAHSLADNSNDISIFDGDRGIVDDTDPDPFIENLQCQSDIGSVTLNSMTFNFLRGNPMSYWYTPVPATFTNGQAQRIRNILEQRVINNTLAVSSIAIQLKWLDLQGSTGTLGNPISEELPTFDGIGRYKNFERGVISWQPETGAHAIWGAIAQRWLQIGREEYGYPITDELPTPDGRGRFNHFRQIHLPDKAEASIYWTPEYGAHEIYGAIRAKWAEMGWETSYLGYPTSREIDFPDIEGGRIQRFERGFLLWTPQNGVTDNVPPPSGPLNF